MSGFKRENRYLVLKRADIPKYLSLADQLEIARLTALIDTGRELDGRPDLECVIVESDWPEYGPTWAAIEKRVDAEAAAQEDNKHYCDAGKWWQVVPLSDQSFLVEIGMHDITLESATCTTRSNAYIQKNRWLTKHNMFCPEG